MNSSSTQTVEQTPTQAVYAQTSRTYTPPSRESIEEKLIIDYLPLVKHIVQKLIYNVRGRVDFDDLISAGTVGLVKAAKRYDPSRNVEFKTYAYIRIRGAVIDEIRAQSFVSSGVHRDIRNIESTYRQLSAEIGRPPGDEELAEALDMPLEKMYRTMQEARRQNFLSIHGLSDDKPTTSNLVPPDRQPGPDQQAERNELLRRLTNALLSLPKRDRQILLLYYERDLTMKETARILGVTESRISQLHASVLFKLSTQLLQ